jgi:hypothetical protein
VAPLGHQHRHLGLDARGDLDHLGGRGHLEVELIWVSSRRRRTSSSWMWRPVLAQVDRDAVGAAQVRLDRRPDRVGLVGAPCLAHGGDVIDVDAELDHKSLILSGRARMQYLPVQALADQRAHEAPRLLARLGSV